MRARGFLGIARALGASLLYLAAAALHQIAAAFDAGAHWALALAIRCEGSNGRPAPARGGRDG